MKATGCKVYLRLMKNGGMWYLLRKRGKFKYSLRVYIEASLIEDIDETRLCNCILFLQKNVNFVETLKNMGTNR